MLEIHGVSFKSWSEVLRMFNAANIKMMSNPVDLDIFLMRKLECTASDLPRALKRAKECYVGAISLTPAECTVLKTILQANPLDAEAISGMTGLEAAVVADALQHLEDVSKMRPQKAEKE